MRTRRIRPIVLLATLLSQLAIGVTTAPPAAATDTDLILIANRYASSTCSATNFRLLVFNLATKQVTNLGQPPIANLTEFTEAKPIDLNRKILALWGGSAGNSGGVGIYDRTGSSPGWKKYFPLPAAFELPSDGRNAHSITLLPRDPAQPLERDHFAIAHTGAFNGSGSGWVVVVDDTGVVKDSDQLASAHGVEWDPTRNAVFAVGYTQIRKYSYNVGTKQLSSVQSYNLPPKGDGSAANGHDLRRRRSDTNYYVTADNEAWIFNPDTASLTEVGTNLGGIKSMDQSFDGRTEYNQMNGSEARFLGSTPWVTWDNACVKPYKGGRFLWAPGEKVYPEDPTGGGGGGTTTWSPTFTVGAGANSWWIEVYTTPDVVQLDVIGKNGQFFMSNLPKQTWGAFAQSPPHEMTAGSLIKLIGRKADGSSAATITFPWLQNAAPATEAGWNASFTISQCNSKLEATISSAAVAAKVRIGTADWVSMTKNSSTGRWERSPGVPIGTKYLIRAYADSSSESAPQAYDAIRTC